MEITKSFLLDRCRRKCLSCDNSKKIVSGHCRDFTCELFDIRKYLIDKSRQLSIFTYAGFMAEVENILQNCSGCFLRDMYFSDIRKTIEEELLRRRCKLPDGDALTSWWGKVATFILPKYGWIKDHSKKRRSPKRGDDYLYRKE